MTHPSTVRSLIAPPLPDNRVMMIYTCRFS